MILSRFVFCVPYSLAIVLSVASPFAAMSEPIRTPDDALIENLLKTQFRQPPSSLMGKFEDWEYKVRRVDVVDDSGFFQHNKILRIVVSGNILSTRILPSGGSLELFAYDGKNLISLNSKKNMSSVLRSENRPLEEAKPTFLASLFCQTILGHGDYVQDLISSTDDVLKFENGEGLFRGNYKVDQEELKKCADKIIPVTLVGDHKSGWTIRFSTLQGYMHELNTICNYEISILPDYDITVKENVLSEKIFSKIPKIMY
jgi:hypothetical protein